MAITTGILIGIVLILIRNIWGYAYSNETEVAKYVAKMMPIIALGNFLDSLQSVLSGSFHHSSDINIIIIRNQTNFEVCQNLPLLKNTTHIFPHNIIIEAEILRLIFLFLLTLRHC